MVASAVSESIVLFAKGVLVEVAGFLRGKFAVVDVQASGIPLLHSDHRLIVGREGLFCADVVHPCINGLSVVLQKLIEV